MNPKVSIIIPVYNTGQFLNQCVDSILLEKEYIKEIIIVDDGSEPETAKACDLLSVYNPQIIVIHQENAGVSAARNNGIVHASGEYIMFIDSDDFIEKGLLRSLVENIKDADFVVSGYSLYNDVLKSKTNVFAGVDKKGAISELALCLNEFINPPYLLGPCFKLFKLQIIMDFNIRFPYNISYCEDAIFVFNYLKYTHSFVSVKNSGYCYRQHGNDTLSTSFREDLFKCDYLLNEAILAFLKEMGNVNNTLLNVRLFKAFILYVNKLSCSHLSKVNKKLIIEKVVREFNLQSLFFEIKTVHLDEYICKKIIQNPSWGILYDIIKMKLVVKKKVKECLIRIKNYV